MRGDDDCERRPASALRGAILWRLRIRGRSVVFPRGGRVANQEKHVRRTGAGCLRPICRLRWCWRWAKIEVPAEPPRVPRRRKAGQYLHSTARIKKDKNNDATDRRTQSTLPIDADAGAVVGGPACVPCAGSSAGRAPRSVV